MNCNIIDLDLAKTYINRCLKRTDDYRYKTILIAMEKLINKEEKKPCATCNDLKCIFR